MLTKIPNDKCLVIFDFYDTIIYSVYHNNNFLRTGINDLIGQLTDAGKLLVVSSDADINDIVRDFGYAASSEFLSKFKKIYGIETVRFDMVDGTVKKYKDLGAICSEQAISIPNAIFIGDNFQGVDEYSANRFGMDYIIVPRKNKDFSFVSLLS
jgi:hypothetical protein